MRKSFFVFCLIWMSPLMGFAQVAYHSITPADVIVDGLNFKGNPILPGDSLLFEPGIRGHIIFRNLEGTRSAPIVIINKTTSVLIESTIQYGVSFQNCRHFTLKSRNGYYPLYDLTITAPNGVGIGLGQKSEHYTIEGITIWGTAGPGILAKTDPDCTFQVVRDNFLQGKVVVRWNQFFETGTEAIYIGSSFFQGQHFNCGGRDTLLFPHLIDSAEVYGNIIRNAGWDGIQISSTNHARVYGNTMNKTGVKKDLYQMNGIIMGEGSSGEVFNNQISHAAGNGIANFSAGPVVYFQNWILTGADQPLPNERAYGMYIQTNRNPTQESYVAAFNNLIVTSGNLGLKWIGTSKPSSDSLANNLVVDYGTPQGLHLDFKDAPNIWARTNLAWSNAGCLIGDTTWQFVQTSFRNQLALMDQGTNLPRFSAALDFHNEPRVQGNGIDIGIFESAQTGLMHIAPEQLVVYPNPIQQKIFIAWNTTQVFCDGGAVSVRLFDLSGRLYHTQTLSDFQPNQLYPIELEQLPSSGQYILQLKGENLETAVQVLVP